MASEPIRDPVKDHLLTPQNSTLIVIDYQSVQVNSIASMDRQLLINNIVGTAKAAVAYGLPVVHSTVNVKSGANRPPIAPLRKALDKIPTYDAPRSTRGRTSSFARPWKRPAARS